MTDIRKAIAVHLGLATFLVVTMFMVVGGWAMTTHISGAVIGQGRVIVEGKAKLVQHLSGGIVQSIDVAEGDRVGAGELLVTLADTQVRANLAIIENQLDEMMLKQTRLEVEISDGEEIEFPKSVRDRMGDPDFATLVDLEVRDFSVRSQARQGLRAQLQEQILQLANLVSGLEEQKIALERQSALVSDELEAKRALYSEKLVTLQEVNLLARESARLDGELSSVIATIARAKGSASETELKIIQVDHDFRTRAADELAVARNRIAELAERQRAATDDLTRMRIRAPQSGTVHELAVNTVGGVVGPGDVLMSIVPEMADILIEVRINSTEIDQVVIGQNVKLRFTAFNQQTSPELTGNVSFISADLLTDPRTDFSYFTIRVSVSDAEVSRLGQPILTGMPAEAFIITADRNVASYLLKPLADQFERAMRSE